MLFFRKDADMWVCPSSPMAARRYEYIEYENGKVLGEKKQCNLGTTKVWKIKFHGKRPIRNLF